MALSSDFIPKGIPELPTKDSLDKNDSFAVVSGNVNHFKTYKTTFGDVENNISTDFLYFNFEDITTNNLTINNRMCCDTIYAETIYGTSVDIPCTTINIEDMAESVDLPDFDTPIFCFAEISSQDGKLIQGGIKQLIPDSRQDCYNLSTQIDIERENLLSILEDYMTELQQQIHQLEISVNNMGTTTDNSDMNLAIDTNNIIDITPMIPTLNNAGTGSEIKCSAFYEIPFGGTLAINHGHYYTIDTYDANNPVTVEPYLFAKSGSVAQALMTQSATNNGNPTIFIKVHKGMNVATGNKKGTPSGKQAANTDPRNCILLYPELNDDLFSSDRTIEVNNLLYDPDSGSISGDKYYLHKGAYDFYQNSTSDKQKYQVFYMDLQNTYSKAVALTCTIFRCTDVSQQFDSSTHFIKYTNSPKELTKNTAKATYHKGYGIKLDSFSIPANSTVTRKYVLAPEDILLLHDGQPTYTSKKVTPKGGTAYFTHTANSKKMLGKKVILLSRGYIDINEDTNYCMTVNLNGSITLSSDLVNLSNIESYWENPSTQKTLQSLELSCPAGISVEGYGYVSCYAVYSDGTVSALDGNSGCTLSIDGEMYETTLDDSEFGLIHTGESIETVEISAWYTDYMQERNCVTTFNVVSAEETIFELSGETNPIVSSTYDYELISSLNTEYGYKIVDDDELEFICEDETIAKFNGKTLSAVSIGDTTLSAFIGDTCLATKNIYVAAADSVSMPLMASVEGSTGADAPELKQDIVVQFVPKNGTQICSFILSDFNAYNLRDYISADSTLSLLGHKDCPILNIGDDVFSETSCVKSVYFPFTVTTFGNNIFKNSTGLTSTNIPFITTTNSSVFEGCENLQKVATGGTMTNIGDRFYKNCENLQSIVVPKKVQKVGYEAFMGCKSVDRMIFLDNLQEIDGTAFDGCENLSTFIVSKNNTNFKTGGGILYNYDLDRLIANPTPETRMNVRYSVKTIDERAFRGTKIESLTLNSNVSSIGLSAFNGCSNLRTITFLPLECPTISAGAFDTGYTSESGAAGVVYLTPSNEGNYIYRYSSGDVALCCENLPPQPTYEYKTLPLVFKMTTTKNKFQNLLFTQYTFNKAANGNVEVDFGDGSVQTFATSQITGKTKNTWNSVKVTHDYTNSSVDSSTKLNPIVTVKFTDNELNILSVGPIFQNYKQISEVWLPKTINRIMPYFASGSTSLTAAHIENCSNLTVIHHEAFKGTYLRTLSCPASVSTFGYNLFEGCNYLTSMDFSQNTNLTSIPTKMFYNCKTAAMSVTLSCVDVQKGVKIINDSAFEGCSKMHTISLPKVIQQVHPRAFYNCSSLSSDLNFLSCVLIGNNSFQNCSNVQNLNIGDGIFYDDVVIGNSAFLGCKQIRKIKLNLKADQLRSLNSKGSYVSNIGTNAFNGVGTYGFNYMKSNFYKTGKNYYTGAELKSVEGLNRVYIPAAEFSNYIKTTESKGVIKYSLQAGLTNLPPPVNPDDTTTKLTSIGWIYETI